MCIVTFSPEEVAEIHARRERNKDCPKCGKVARHVLTETLAKRPSVATICDDCGTLYRHGDEVL